MKQSDRAPMVRAGIFFRTGLIAIASFGDVAA
jgi:hypothetical protein